MYNKSNVRILQARCEEQGVYWLMLTGASIMKDEFYVAASNPSAVYAAIGLIRKQSS